MKKQKGREQLFVLTDSINHSSELSRFEAIEAAQRSDTR